MESFISSIPLAFLKRSFCVPICVPSHSNNAFPVRLLQSSTVFAGNINNQCKIKINQVVVVPSYVLHTLFLFVFNLSAFVLFCHSSLCEPYELKPHNNTHT